MIKLLNVFKSYTKENFLTNISFEIKNNEFAFLYGHPSAGKTTILRLLYMEELIDNGLILINDINISKIKKNKIPEIRRMLGLMFQDNKLIKTKTVFENISVPLEIRKIPVLEIKHKIYALYDTFNIGKLSEKYPEQLSYSEQKIVSFCRTVISECQIYILDEPFDGLTQNTEKMILDYITNKKREHDISVIIATSRKELLKIKSDKIIYLKNGTIEKITKGYFEDLTEFNLDDISEENIL